MIIKEVNLDNISRDEYFALLKILLIGFRYKGYIYDNHELRELEDIIYRNYDDTIF